MVVVEDHHRTMLQDEAVDLLHLVVVNVDDEVLVAVAPTVLLPLLLLLRAKQDVVLLGHLVVVDEEQDPGVEALVDLAADLLPEVVYVIITVFDLCHLVRTLEPFHLIISSLLHSLIYRFSAFLLGTLVIHPIATDLLLLMITVVVEDIPVCHICCSTVIACPCSSNSNNNKMNPPVSSQVILIALFYFVLFYFILFEKTISDRYGPPPPHGPPLGRGPPPFDPSYRDGPPLRGPFPPMHHPHHLPPPHHRHGPPPPHHPPHHPHHHAGGGGPPLPSGGPQFRPDAQGRRKRGFDEGPPGVSLLVRNVAPNVTQHDLTAAFSRIGKIRDVYIPRDYHSQQPKGFAFIEYETPEMAQEARDEMDRFVVRGRELEVVFAQERRKTPNEMRGRVVPELGERGGDRGGSSVGGGSADGGGGGRRGGGEFERSSSFERHKQRERQASRGSGGRGDDSGRNGRSEKAGIKDEPSNDRPEN